MALNTWWTSDLTQRYWMEVVTTESIGVSLQSPKLSRTQWSYDLVSQVQAGDRVLHWETAGAERALVGWSEVAAPATTVERYTWQPRGTSGRALEGPRTTPGWVAPLGGLHRFVEPPTSATLQTLRDALVALNLTLEDAHGKPTYAPFYLYGGTQIRAQQGYMMKFPVELFDILPGIDSARLDASVTPADAHVPEDFQPRRKKAPAGRTTRAQDPKLRAAIERRSLDVAREYYDSIGGTDYRERGKPYDIDVTVAGVARHCEVKGSSMIIDTVELTINEVDHGKEYVPVDLIVVDGIVVARNMATGDIDASGGTLRVWPDWTPEEQALRATKFAYRLPDGG